MNQIITFSSIKGGAGKTTSVANTAACLAQIGFSVLVVDADYQANLTSTFLSSTPERTLYDVLVTPSIALPILQIRECLSILPASHQMFAVDDILRLRHADGQNPLHILRTLLARVREEFDFILLDPPPSDNLMMRGAILAATDLVMVAKPDPYCVSAIRELCSLVRAVREQNNGQPKFDGILLTDVECGAIGHRQGEEAIRREAKAGSVFSSKIRHSRPLARAAGEHMDVISFNRKSNGAADYQAFTQELLMRLGYDVR